MIRESGMSTDRNIRIAREIVEIARELVSENEKIEVFDFSTGEITANIRNASMLRNAALGGKGASLFVKIGLLLQSLYALSGLGADTAPNENLVNQAVDKANVEMKRLVMEAEQEMKEAIHAVASPDDYVVIDSKRMVDIYKKKNGTRCNARYIPGDPVVIEENGIAYVTGMKERSYDYEILPCKVPRKIEGAKDLRELITGRCFDIRGLRGGGAHTLVKFIDRLHMDYFSNGI